MTEKEACLKEAGIKFYLKTVSVRYEEQASTCLRSRNEKIVLIDKADLAPAISLTLLQE